MTEVPEYLFERSRERRRDLGLLTGDGSGPDGGGGEVSSAPVAAATPAVAAPAAAAVAPYIEPPKPLSPAAQAAISREKIPLWMLPVLFLLPVWGFTYIQLLEDDAPDVITALSRGAQIYGSSGCSGCHGAGGGGGVGYQLNEGEVLLTFPTIDPTLEWIAAGTDDHGLGNPIGDPNRPGGAHIAGERADMPGFAVTLEEADIYAVARFVREQIGDEELTPEEVAERDLQWEELGGGNGAGDDEHG